jgi:hypothetical protein
MKSVGPRKRSPGPSGFFSSSPQGRRDRGQVHLPPPAIRGPLEVRRQELPVGPSGDARLKPGLGLRPRLEPGELELVHGREFLTASGPAVVLGRDVHDDEAPHPLRVPAREDHRHLAAHAVADELRVADAVGVHPGEDVRRHVGVGHPVRVGRLAVVPQVERVDPPAGGQGAPAVCQLRDEPRSPCRRTIGGSPEPPRSLWCRASAGGSGWVGMGVAPSCPMRPSLQH